MKNSVVLHGRNQDQMRLRAARRMGVNGDELEERVLRRGRGLGDGVAMSKIEFRGSEGARGSGGSITDPLQNSRASSDFQDSREFSGFSEFSRILRFLRTRKYCSPLA